MPGKRYRSVRKDRKISDKIMQYLGVIAIFLTEVLSG